MFRRMLVNLLALHAILAFLLFDHYIVTEYFPWVPQVVWTVSYSAFSMFEGSRTAAMCMKFAQAFFAMTVLPLVFAFIPAMCAIGSETTTDIETCVRRLMNDTMAAI